MNLSADRFAPGRDVAVASLDGLSACDDLVAAHLDAVQRRFGARGLGIIDLPDLGESSLVGEQIGVGAVLYWCREVEQTGLIAVVEGLAKQLARGELGVPVDGAALDRLYALWRGRGDRFTATERQALYARVFGDGAAVVQGFDTWMELLVRALVELGRRRDDLGIADLQARIGVLATDVGRHLSGRATGIAGFAAREILAQVREAFAILRTPSLAIALGGGEPWTLVARIAPQVLGTGVDIPRHVDRAEAGLEILRWVGAHASSLRDASLSLARRDALVRAAERWHAWRGQT